MIESPDAVVVGAGIVGCAVAYELAAEGMRVVIIEKDAIGAGASGIAHGVLSEAGPLYTGGTNAILDRLGREFYPTFIEKLRDESTIDPGYDELTGIALAFDEAEETLFKNVIAELGSPTDMRWASIDDCRALEPRLTTSARGGVVYRHQQVDGYRLTLALTEVVERRGGALASGEVTGLLFDRSRVVGVRSTAGDVSAGVVVLAMGPWSGHITEWTGRPIPVRPSHGEVLHVQLPGPPVEVPIITARYGPVLPRGDGAVMIGSVGGRTMASDGRIRAGADGGDFERSWNGQSTPTQANLEHMINTATRIMPTIAEAKLLAHLAGARPGTPDGLAVIGQLDGVVGLYLATGHGTKGVHQGPITGQIVADMIVRGKTRHHVPLARFSPDRFGSFAQDRQPTATEGVT